MRKTLVLFALASSAAFADTLCADLTTLFASGTCNGAFFQQIIPRPTGSGVIDPFIRISTNLGIEEGLNTDARPYGLNNEAQDTATFDHSEALSLINIATGSMQLENGLILPGPSTQKYLQLMLDINQTGSSPLLSLDELVIALSNTKTDNPAITLDGSGRPTIPTLAGSVIFNLDAGAVDRWIALNYALDTGSGSGDMFAFVPVTAAQIAACGAGCDVEVYSAFGLQGGAYQNNDGYEEWSAVRAAPTSSGVPEPSALWLAGAGLALVALRRTKV